MAKQWATERKGCAAAVLRSTFANHIFENQNENSVATVLSPSVYVFQMKIKQNEILLSAI